MSDDVRVTVVWTDNRDHNEARVGTCDLTWVTGRSVRAYLKSPCLLPFHLLGIVAGGSGYCVDGNTSARLRLNSAPAPNSTIVIKRTGK